MDKGPNQLIELPSLGSKKLKVRMVQGDKCHMGLTLIGLFFSIMLIFGSISDMKEVYPDFRVFQNPEYIEADVSGQCRRSEARRRDPYPPVKCTFYIVYEGKNYQKEFSYLGALPDYSNVRVVRSQKDHTLISVDLALQHITANFMEKLLWVLIGLLASIGTYYLLINRLKVTYFKYEINWGNSDLTLISVDRLQALGNGQGIKYFNNIGKRRIKVVYGDLVGSKGSDPYFMYCNNRLYVLIVRNKDTDNFLVVDRRLTRLKIYRKEREQLIHSLNSLSQ